MKLIMRVNCSESVNFLLFKVNDEFTKTGLNDVNSTTKNLNLIKLDEKL